MRAFLFSGLVLLASCAAKSAPPPAPGPQPVMMSAAPQCQDGPPICGNDRHSVVQCQRGQWVPIQPCLGPQGCSPLGGAIQCDTTYSRANDPCAPEGGYACTPDLTSMTQCRRGRAIVVSSCRGSKGCSVGDAVACDHSKAAMGDPCDGAGQLACSTDFRTLLTCNATGVYQVGEACRSSCLPMNGKALCQ